MTRSKAGRYLPWTLAWSFELWYKLKEAIEVELNLKHTKEALQQFNAFYRWIKEPGPQFSLKHSQYYLPEAIFKYKRWVKKATSFYIDEHCLKLLGPVQNLVEEIGRIVNTFGQPNFLMEARFLEKLKIAIKGNISYVQDRTSSLSRIGGRGHGILQMAEDRYNETMTYVLSAAAILRAVRFYLGEEPDNLCHPDKGSARSSVSNREELMMLTSRRYMFREQEEFEMREGTGLQRNLPEDAVDSYLLECLYDDYEDDNDDDDTLKQQLCDYWGYYEKSHQPRRFQSE